MTDHTRSETSADGGLTERTEATAATARDQAATVAHTAQSQLAEVKDEAAAQAQGVVQDAKVQARRLVDDSRRELTRQAEDQTARLAGGVRDISQQLQGMLRGGEAPQGMVADLASQAADAAARFADTLEQRRPDELLDELRGLARRRPGMFLLGALGAGLVVGRLVKAADTHGIVDAAKGAVTGEDGPTPTNGSHSSASPAMGGPAGAPSTSTTSPAPTAPTFQSTSSDPQWAVRP
ncbi:MAG TPA: hypothetical protein VFV32_10260 [Acidimicrobiales bacterium]|nr:hypothetical protein [Acidimicrobiales bacterium]